jgi:hypothetical protein
LDVKNESRKSGGNLCILNCFLAGKIRLVRAAGFALDPAWNYKKIGRVNQIDGLHQLVFSSEKVIMAMNKNLFAITFLGLGLAFCGLGCHSSDSAAPAATPTAAPAPPTVAIPANSPFAKIQVGMDIKEVTDLIGQPTDTSAHITGKQFIPYYYGGDTHRVEYIYKGLGRVVFAPPHAFTSDLRVIEINYNPNESGYNN